MNELAKLKEKRGALLAAVKEIMVRAKARPDGEQDLTAEESAKVDEHYAEFDKCGRSMETLERQGRLATAEAELDRVIRRTSPAGTDAGVGGEAIDFGEAVRALDAPRQRRDRRANLERAGAAASTSTPTRSPSATTRTASMTPTTATRRPALNRSAAAGGSAAT